MLGEGRGRKARRDLLPELIARRGTMALGQLGPVLAQDERAVGVLRHLEPQRLQHQHLADLRRERVAGGRKE